MTHDTLDPPERFRPDATFRTSVRARAAGLRRRHRRRTLVGTATLALAGVLAVGVGGAGLGRRDGTAQITAADDPASPGRAHFEPPPEPGVATGPGWVVPRDLATAWEVESVRTLPVPAAPSDEHRSLVRGSRGLWRVSRTDGTETADLTVALDPSAPLDDHLGYDTTRSLVLDHRPADPRDTARSSRPVVVDGRPGRRLKAGDDIQELWFNSGATQVTITGRGVSEGELGAFAARWAAGGTAAAPPHGFDHLTYLGGPQRATGYTLVTVALRHRATGRRLLYNLAPAGYSGLGANLESAAGFRLRPSDGVPVLAAGIPTGDAVAATELAQVGRADVVATVSQMGSACCPVEGSDQAVTALVDSLRAAGPDEWADLVDQARALDGDSGKGLKVSAIDDPTLMTG